MLGFIDSAIYSNDVKEIIIWCTDDYKLYDYTARDSKDFEWLVRYNKVTFDKKFKWFGWFRKREATNVRLVE